MDFFSIFQNNTTDNTVDKKKVVKRKNNTSTSNEEFSKGGTLSSIDTRSPSNDDSIKNDIYNTTLYKNIKRGDFIKIIGVKGSHLNSYKGYTGEIKDYKRDQDFALVFLHGINNVSIVKFPINHFIIAD
jgi:hypothetical protein